MWGRIKLHCCLLDASAGCAAGAARTDQGYPAHHQQIWRLWEQPKEAIIGKRAHMFDIHPICAPFIKLSYMQQECSETQVQSDL